MIDFINDDLTRAAQAWDEASAVLKNLMALSAVFGAVLLVEFFYWGASQQ